MLRFGTLALVALTTTWLLPTGASLAHHSHASLNKEDIQLHSGIVSGYEFRMPHVFLTVDAPTESGEIAQWTIELLHPAGLMGYGWDANSFQPGDRITWEGPRDYNPNRYYSGLTWAERGDGTRFYHAGGDFTPEEQQVQPSSDFSGLWNRDSKRVGFSYAPKPDWPYNETGLAMVAAFDETQNPQLDCYNPGPPKSTLLPYPIKIWWQDEKTMVMDYDMRDQRRVIPIGRSPQPMPPSRVGQSHGWWEGDELVVETTNFIADRWGSYTGVDSSEKKHLIERFALIEDGFTLRIQMLLTDPQYLSDTVEIDYYLTKQHDRNLLPDSCSLEAARLFVEAGYE